MIKAGADEAATGENAVRIMIPFNTCNNIIAGVMEKSTGKLISLAVAQLKKEIG